MLRVSLTRLLALSAVCAVAGCRGVQEPAQPVETLLVAGGDSGRFAVVEPSAGRVVGTVGPIPRYQDAFSRSADSSMLYVVAAEPGIGRQLLGLDLRTLRIAWREQLGDALDQRRARFGGLAVYGDYALATSPDGARIFVARACREDMCGVAVLDARTRDAVGFVGPLHVQPGGMRTLPPGPAAPAGAILIVGRRDRDAVPSLDWLFVLDPLTFELSDSVSVTTPQQSRRAPTLGQVLPAPDRRHVYLGGVDWFYKYDLLAHRVTATTPRVSNGSLFVAPDGGTLYQTDPGDVFDSPGSGLLYVYDADLTPRGPIDLRSASVGGVAPVTFAAAVSRDGARVYVSAGTVRRGPTFGTQPARVLVIDATAGTIIRVVPLNDWGPGPVYVR